ncbi:hypothetical protein L2089_11765 [Paenibacillus hunanensis]|uniref:hypothetical protein n=1 Tax=Paenibacillus hunanensis TaxID=539262 RepID=UPI002026CF7E|nr:hypothetical protein [Paenibacillus hunanensis]MCL9661366.1 hypothetical protein [Paenibacillus hunanensis]
MKKIVIASVVSIAVLAGQVSYTYAAESTTSNEMTQNSQYTQAFIEKVNPYVVLDKESKQFNLLLEAKKILNEKELISAQDLIAKTNKFVNENRDQLYQTSDNKLSSNIQQSSEARSLVKVGNNFSYDIAWWGTQLHFSHAFVQKFKDNILLYSTTVAGVTAAAQATMAAFGATPPGWFGGAFAAVAGLGAYTFISADQGQGTYVDFYGWYGAIGVTVPVPIVHGS